MSSITEPLEPRRLMSTVAVLSGATLLYVDSASPTVALAKVKVSGLAARERLLGIDFRPSTGQLYGIGSSSRLYVIDPTTGVATNAQPQGLAFDPVLSGTDFGVAFSPVSDLLRVVSDTDVNFRLYSPTGFVIDYDENVAGTQTDVAVAYVDTDSRAGANPNVQAVAYTRLVGADETTAFGIDVDANALVRLGSIGGSTEPRDSGRLSTVGALGIDVIPGFVGLDVDTNGATDVALAALATDPKAPSTLYTIDLTSGVATSVGVLSVSRKPITDLAVVPTGHSLLVADKKNRLVRVDSNLPNVPQAVTSINGLAAGEKLAAVARRPGDGAVFAFTNKSRLYQLDTATGLATPVGAGAIDVPLRKGARIAMDFNPATGAIHVVDSAQENLRIDAATGQVIDADGALAGTQFDTPLSYASTDVSAAFRPSVTGAAFIPGPTLYGIDANRNALVTVGSPNGTTPATSGQVFTVGSLGVDAKDPVAFDILTSSDPDAAYALFAAKGRKMSLHRIDLTTGVATANGLLVIGVSPVGMIVL